MNIKTLNRFIADAPASPGVYTWRNSRNRVLYVGKANDIHSRLTSYRRAGDPRIRRMIREASRIEWETTATGMEALILESDRIKTRRPKFNIVMRDDKQYAYVGITDESFPQVVMTRQLTGRQTKKPFKHFIGPFTDAGALRTTLAVLSRLFPTCRCKTKHHVRCLNAHIGRCPGYCCLKETPTAAQRREYAVRIRTIKALLSGKRSSFVRSLTKRMRTLGEATRLEEAQHLKDTIARIERVFENAQLNAERRMASIQRSGALAQLETELRLTREPRRIEGYDIAHIQEAHPSGVMVVFEDGTSDNAQYRLFNINRSGGGDTAMLREVLTRRLAHDEWPVPDVIVVDGGKAQLNVVLRVLSEHDRDIPVVALTKDDSHKADHILTSQDARVRTLADLPRAMRDLLVRIDREAHRFVIKHYRKRHRKALLGVR